MIYCVWYPSGGFGHYINSVINLYGQGFKRPKKNLTFSSDGNSHGLDYVAPSYCQDQQFYLYEFDHSFNYSVIVDNGINNQSTKFLDFFPGAKVIKMCYDDFSWPVVAYTMIYKAMVSNFDTELSVDKDKWVDGESWVRREKYFLFLRDHPMKSAWRPSDFSTNIMLQDLLDYNQLCDYLNRAGIELSDFTHTHTDWAKANQKYFEPVQIAENFIHQDFDQPINDLWTQAVVYYQIWQHYGIEVPHNDFADFFDSHAQFRDWLESAR